MEPESMTREERVRNNLRLAEEGYSKSLEIFQRANMGVIKSRDLLDLAREQYQEFFNPKEA